jgi:hypothetical protein
MQGAVVASETHKNALKAEKKEEKNTNHMGQA